MAKHDPEFEHEHIAIPGYLLVFGVLVVGTILTYIVALQDLDFFVAHIDSRYSSDKRRPTHAQSVERRKMLDRQSLCHSE